MESKRLRQEHEKVTLRIEKILAIHKSKKTLMVQDLYITPSIEKICKKPEHFTRR